MTAEVYWTDDTSPGRLGIVPRPRGGDWLEDEIQAWNAAGIDSVISLLTAAEVAEFQLESEQEYCLKKAIAFTSLPSPDRDVLASFSPYRKIIAHVVEDLDAGKHVVVHCRQGIGRSCLIIAAIMIDRGEQPDRAFDRIAHAGGRAVPDTPGAPPMGRIVRRRGPAKSSTLASRLIGIRHARSTNRMNNRRWIPSIRKPAAALKLHAV